MPDVEWSAWYLADANGLFADRGVDVRARHGGPNTPAVAQVLAAGDADIGVAGDELQLIKANNEGADFVALGAMYQRVAARPDVARRAPNRHAEDLVGKRIGGPQGDQIRIDAMFRVNGLRARLRVRPDELRPAAARRRRDGRHHVRT